MKSLFTSSLDTIQPPTPFVNALHWDSYRKESRTSRGPMSGNRNCLQASSILNPDTIGAQGAMSAGQVIPLLFLNSVADRKPTPKSTTIESSLSASAVDCCFMNASIAFLDTPHIGCESPAGDCDLELGLLESVQEIAISLARRTPKRAEIHPNPASNSAS